jgi:hypothetical protein
MKTTGLAVARARWRRFWLVPLAACVGRGGVAEFVVMVEFPA